MKVAVAVRPVVDTVSKQLWAAVTLSQPVQPLKLEPACGAAARATWVPLGKLAEQEFAPDTQFIPDGLLVTVPEPSPANVTLREATAVNVATMVRGIFDKLTEQVTPATLSQPVHPPSIEPFAGAAVRIT